MTSVETNGTSTLTINRSTLALDKLDEPSVRAWSESLGDPDWLAARRLEALAVLQSLEPPTKRDEPWRFTDPALARADEIEVRADAGTAPAAAGLLAGEGEATLRPGGLVTVADGASTVRELDPQLAAAGVVLTDLRTAVHEHADIVAPRLMREAAPFDDDWFLALHALALTDGTFLYVPAGVEVELPIGALQWRSLPGATFTHTLVVVEPRASLTFVQQQGSAHALGGHAFHHGVTELLVGAEASVQLLSLQEWDSPELVHFGLQRTVLGERARLRSFVVTLGGKVVRISPETRMLEGAEADFLGATFADEGQHFEHRATTHHTMPHGRSQLLYKGGLLGGSRNVFYGNILIYPGARGTDASQTMRNLVLSPNASAEAIPFLEIENSDVRCAHAAATGRVDEEHLFYLQSRGIPYQQAKRLVVFGFFDEILRQVTIPAVRQRLAAALEAELEAELADAQT